VAEGDEFTGRTVDDAVAEAEAQFGLPRDELEVEVLSQGTRGVFGIRAEPARIRVHRRLAAGKPREERLQTVTEEAPRGAPSAVAAPPATKPETRATRNGTLAEEATEVLRQLLQSMGFRAQVSVQNPENPLTLAVHGENLGVLIGRRGDNLSALQFMVNLILSKNRRQWPKVVLDIENYRARREESLRALADRIAYRVRRNGRPFTLEAMPASDRRIIHVALRDRSDVETYSIGEGPARRVVVAPKRSEASSAYR
jgi:spoIIIJ-associated protein